jgi:hypothetical protein
MMSSIPDSIAFFVAFGPTNTTCSVEQEPRFLRALLTAKASNSKPMSPNPILMEEYSGKRSSASSGTLAERFTSAIVDGGTPSRDFDFTYASEYSNPKKEAEFFDSWSFIADGGNRLTAAKVSMIIGT